MTRLGLIGSGAWGRNYIATARGLDGIDLLRVASLDADVQGLVDPRCQVTADWREVAEAGDLDGIIVATPPALHAEMARLAMACGLAVLIEKPLTRDLSEAEDLLAFAEAHGARVLVDHIHLYGGPWAALKAALPDLGPIRHLTGEAGNWGPFRADCPVLWDWAPHDISMCLDLVGRPPVSVTARRLEDGPEGENLALGLDFGEGLEASIIVGNRMAAKKRLFVVECAEGTLRLDDTVSEGKLIRQPSGQPLPHDRQSPLANALRALAKTARKMDPDLNDLRLGCQVVRVLDRLEKALVR